MKTNKEPSLITDLKRAHSGAASRPLPCRRRAVLHPGIVQQGGSIRRNVSHRATFGAASPRQELVRRDHHRCGARRQGEARSPLQFITGPIRYMQMRHPLSMMGAEINQKFCFRLVVSSSRSVSLTVCSAPERARYRSAPRSAGRLRVWSGGETPPWPASATPPDLSSPVRPICPVLSNLVRPSSAVAQKVTC